MSAFGWVSQNKMGIQKSRIMTAGSRKYMYGGIKVKTRKIA